MWDSGQVGISHYPTHLQGRGARGEGRVKRRSVSLAPRPSPLAPSCAAEHDRAARDSQSAIDLRRPSLRQVRLPTLHPGSVPTPRVERRETLDRTGPGPSARGGAAASDHRRPGRPGRGPGCA